MISSTLYLKKVLTQVKFEGKETFLIKNWLENIIILLNLLHFRNLAAEFETCGDNDDDSDVDHDDDDDMLTVMMMTDDDDDD